MSRWLVFVAHEVLLFGWMLQTASRPVSPRLINSLRCCLGEFLGTLHNLIPVYCANQSQQRHSPERNKASWWTWRRSPVNMRRDDSAASDRLHDTLRRSTGEKQLNIPSFTLLFSIYNFQPLSYPSCAARLFICWNTYQDVQFQTMAWTYKPHSSTRPTWMKKERENSKGMDTHAKQRLSGAADFWKDHNRDKCSEEVWTHGGHADDRPSSPRTAPVTEHETQYNP